MKVLLNGSVGERFTEGRDLIGIARTLNRLGADVHFAPNTFAPPIPPLVASLLAKKPQQEYDLLLSTLRTIPADKSRTKIYLGHSTVFETWEVKDFDVVLHKDPDTINKFKLMQPEAVLLPFTGGFEADLFPAVRRNWSGQLRFLVSDYGAEVARLAFDHLYKYQSTLMEAVEPVLAAVDYSTLDNASLARVIKDFHVLICTDGYPNIQQEFMSTGGMVIAPKKGVHMYWLNSQFSGGYTLADPVDLSDEILAVIREPGKATAKAEIAQTSAQGYSWEEALSKLFLNLESMTEKGKALRSAFLRLEPMDAK